MKHPELKPDGKSLKRLLELAEDFRKINAGRCECWDDEAWELSSELDGFLIELFHPHNVADIRAMPEPLHRDAILSLIERDAANAYDQIDGFCDLVIMEGIEEQILEGCQPTDSGLEMCEWITKNIPEETTRDQ